jgi:hypothetical protein
VPHFTRYTFALSESESEEQQHLEVPMDLFLEADEDSMIQKRPREDFQGQEMQMEDEIKPLNLNSGFKFSISPQGKMFLPAVDGSLVSYSLDFDNTPMISGLKIQMEGIKQSIESKARGVENDEACINMLEEVVYKLARNYSGMETNTEFSSEAMMWSLFCVLFGNPNINMANLLEIPTLEPLDTENTTEINLKRKKALVSWLCFWGFDSTNIKDTGRTILYNILNGKILEAVKCAEDNNFAFLATLLSLSSTDNTREKIGKQLALWKKNKIFDTFPESIAIIYEILAGNIDAAQAQNWWEKLILLATFKYRKNASFNEIFIDFQRNYSGDEWAVSKYKEGHLDICYNLMRFFVNPSSLSCGMFNPFTFQEHFSLGTCWLLYYCIFTYSKFSNFKKFISPSADKYFTALNMLSLSFAEELINENKWDLAVYIMRFHPNSESIIRDVINRNIHLDSSGYNIEEYVDIPSSWYDEARALFQKSIFQFKSSFNRFIECGIYYKSYELLMNEIGPELIIQYAGNELYTKLYVEVLEKLIEHAGDIPAWLLGGDVYVKYCDLASVFDGRSKFANFEEIQAYFNTIKFVFKGIGDLPKASLKQRIAIGIMEGSLNSWKLILLKARDLIHNTGDLGYCEPCLYAQNEDLLRFTENLAYKFVRNISLTSS